MNEAITNQ